MKKNILLIITLLFILKTDFSSAQSIVINEILSSNSNSIQDEDGTYQDWIELYNASSNSVNLSGYGLSDDTALPLKWTFPNISMSPGQYLIVWASDKNRSVAGNPLHTNFKISASGDNILLSNPLGTFVDQIPPVNLQPNVSYGRFPNGTGAFVYFGTPTPNAANTTTGYSEELSPPVFSQNSEFLTSNFNLTISSLQSGTTILYTLDGSEPDENNLSGTTYNYKNQYPQNPGRAFGSFLQNSFKTNQYSNPIPISDRSSLPNKISNISTTFDFTPPYFPNGPIFKGTIVKAKVIKPGALTSETITKNYFISSKGATRFSIPVLSISFDENKMYDYYKGISVAGVDFDNWRKANPNVADPGEHVGNFTWTGIDYEKDANMSYFVNGQEVINQKIGIRIHGAYSRRYPSKSLNLYARSDYGNSNMPYNFFKDEPYTSYERLVAKNAGSDFYMSLIRDPLTQTLVKNLRFETEAYQHVIAIMNGEYWGILNLREHYDNNYFKQVYNIPSTQIDLLENDGYTVDEGDNTDYFNMFNYIKNNSLATTANFNYIQTRMDTDNFMDYFIAEIFYNNSDWPGNNIVFWRKKTNGFQANAPYGHDGRWRWAMHDMDSTLQDYNFNSLARATDASNTDPLVPSWSTLILRKLLENNNFKTDFINRFADLLNTNFLPNRITSTIDSMSAVLAPEMNDQYFRWKAPVDNGDWQYFLNDEKAFANQRTSYQRQHIEQQFNIKNTVNITLNVSDASQGYIKISTINIINGTPGITGNPYPWTGIYFQNIPIKVKAIANPGYVFDHWTGDSTSTQDEITLTPANNLSLTAVFTKDNKEYVEPIYFWVMDNLITNGAQLTQLNATFKPYSNGIIKYQSCINGYPLPSTDPNYGKASMERRNLPTDINYRPDANNNLDYASSNLKGLQIKEPLQKDGLENIMILDIPTTGFKNIKVSFAAINELTHASSLVIDYSISSGSPSWITDNLQSSTLSITSAYQLFEIDFSNILTSQNNSNFKVRIRFTGSNMTVDNGNRITFNNIAVDGIKMPFYYTSPNTFTVGTTISNLTPNISQTVTGYSILPNLPAGLTLNSTSGIISGKPTLATTLQVYTVTANTSSGNLASTLLMTVNDIPPTNLSYNTPKVFIKGTQISNLTPTVSGGSVTNYSINPLLPLGLNLNQLTGIISGTPNEISAAKNYTITALNSGGSTTFTINITVNDAAPTNLSYNTPNIFVKGTKINNLSPTISGGTIVNFSINQNLPQGLSFDTQTGIISGIPSEISATKNYTITAQNSGGTTTFNINITVNDIAPTNLSYNTPNIFTKGTQINNLIPTVSGGNVISYSINPTLPQGLNFDSLTGIISGTPTKISSAKNYTVTAQNSGGSTFFAINITINDIAPNNLSYATPNIFTKGTQINNLSPTVSGGSVLNYSINPNLPQGISIDSQTGIISGTPTEISLSKNYTITAQNSGGSTTFTINITVNDTAPTNLNYNTPNIYTKGIQINNLIPIASGGIVTNYSINPNLPQGLNFDTQTGIISGTPAVISPGKNYTITAQNSGGTTLFTLNITINDVSVTNLNYNTPNIFTKGTQINNLIPIVSGGTVTNYSINPNLPQGLNLDSQTGIISGTPSTISPSKNYTITAQNSGGSTSFTLSITINDIAPTNLSYNTPNVFTKGTQINNIIPNVFGGNIINYSINPNLPQGLSLEAQTGVISGIPNQISSAKNYIITAQNSGGSTTFTISIAVNDIAPINLSYISPNTFTKGSQINDLVPTIYGGNIISYSINPNLPQGLNFDSISGIISGVPTQISFTKTYTVTAQNSGGSTTFNINITVNDFAPTNLSYNTPNIFTKGTQINNLIPIVSGGTVTNYSINPTLPQGLNFDSLTGIISGTPTEISTAKNYMVMAQNSGGSTLFSINITINDTAPNNLSYNTPNIFNKGSQINNLIPSVSGGSVISYSVIPNLPQGLNLDIQTGIISGTPTEISSSKSYTITAQNSGGSTTFTINIAINDIAPNNLSYNSPNIFTKGTSINNLTPSVSGGNIIIYSINNNLPQGLNFDSYTGIISGTPTQISPTQNYIITAQNSGGSTFFTINITVNDIPPTNLSYNSPNIFTKDIAITNLVPLVSGGIVENYNITPNLPSGLNLDSISGIISGTPTETTGIETYKVTAQNTGGNTSFDLIITIQNDLTLENNKLNELKIYPNPFSDKIKIIGFNQPFSYKLFTIDGKLIHSEANASNELEFGELAKGVYLLEVKSNEFSTLKKIIKNR